jgi:hypothetical protein
MNLCIKYSNKKLDNIEQKHSTATKQLVDDVFGDKNFNHEATKHDVKNMFKIIDNVFFNEEIEKMLKANKIQLKFSVSGKLKSTAGMYIKYNDKLYGLKLSTPITNNLFKKIRKNIKYEDYTIFGEKWDSLKKT